MLGQLDFNFNNEFIKYVVVAATSPWWLPFVKALVTDFNDALRDEGGLLGYEPTDRKLRELNRERGEYDSVLVSEPLQKSAQRSPYRSPRSGSPPPSSPKQGRGSGGAPNESRRGGFRDPNERRRSAFGN